MPPRRVITIGNFDGVHMGHRALIDRARSLGDSVVALVFDPHPLTILAPSAAPPRLTDLAARSRLLRDAGVDHVAPLVPTTELLRLEPREFVQDLVSRFGPVAFVEGSDFHFGRGRSGNVSTLRALGEELGFAVDIVEPIDVVLNDHQLVRASSTLARWLVAHGRLADAARVLGRPYSLSGTVTKGDRLGRTIGFPTANLECDTLLPAAGIYAGVAHLPTGASFPAAVHVGPRPTLGCEALRVEAYLIGVPRDGDAIAGLDEYGWSMSLDMLGFVRDIASFAGIESLRAQIERDVDRTLELVDMSMTTMMKAGVSE